MIDYAELLAAARRYLGDTSQPDDGKAIPLMDQIALADQMAAELSTDPITPERLAADGWDVSEDLNHFGKSIVTHAYDDVWKFYSDGSNHWYVRTMGELRTLIRIEELRQHALQLDQRPQKSTPGNCLMIQWSQLHTDINGDPVCPECGAPAENVIGIVGEPCWAHIPKRLGHK